jgi:ribonuclease VapC
VIIDTSALVAIARGEPHADQLEDALFSYRGTLPAPVIVEFYKVTALAGGRVDPSAIAMIEKLKRIGFVILHFDEAHALAAADAYTRYGKGNGAGGLLNIVDLMVYGVAKVLRQPLLCAGKEFAATDLELHAASRAD